MPVRRSSVVPAVILALLLAATASDAAVRVRDEGAPAGAIDAPQLLRPVAGERLDEDAARVEVAPALSAKDVRVVVSRVPFDPTTWTTVPTGSAWAVVPVEAAPMRLAGRGLADPTDTPLWCAVVWTDSRTGALRAGPARSFTLVPRFANRVGVGAALAPSALGRLESSPAFAKSIELTAGYTLVPGEAPPVLPEGLRRVEAPTDGAPSTVRGAYLVQFGAAPPDSARASIERVGGTVVSPIAGGSFLVRMPDAAVASLEQEAGQPWVAPYEPAYKLSRAFADTVGGTVDATALLFPDGDAPAVEAGLRALGATQVRSHRGLNSHTVRFELARDRIAEAAAITDLAWLEPSPHFTFQNDLAKWVIQSGVADSFPVFARGLRGQGQIVMTSDSGVRPNHEMFFDSTLAINTWGDYPSHRKIVAYKPGSDSPDNLFGDAAEVSYHGTHTAGTVLGNPTPYSNAPFGGMAPDAKLYFMDLGGSGGGGLLVPDDLGELFLPSYTGNAAGRARISSNSWGAFSQARYTITSMQVDQFIWDHPDYFTAFSAGNIGTFGATNNPGLSKNVLTVGATGNGDHMTDFANFSSRGPTRDGRRKPTVVAPGVDVISSYGSTRYAYQPMNGTSMATPAVAGAMALVRQYLTEGWYPTGAPVAANAIEPSAALMRAIAVAGARNDVTGFRAPDNSIGYGRLTIDDVLYFPGDSLKTLLIDTGDGLANGQFVEYQVQVADPYQPLKIALCWTDPAGNPASEVQLINDLDLVVSHGGVSYRGNYLLNNISAPGGYRDSLNVEEFVRLAVPQAGLWTIRVEGRHVAQGPQPFALCVTGGVGGSAGAVAVDRFEYALNDTLEIEVIDGNVTGPVRVEVGSTTEPWVERLTLTGSNGVYRGSIPLVTSVPQPGNGILAVSTGDLLTVTYADASTGMPVAATARVDVHVPTITNVKATVLGSKQALITWTTDIAAASRVRFGSTALGTVVDSSGWKNEHAILLTGLTPSTVYRYDVESTTLKGQTSRDSVGGAHRSFSTRPTGSLALLMDDPNPAVLETWLNALAHLGWDADVFPAAANEPPLVGNSSVGLRSYDAVLWQVDPDKYPPFSDAQRAAIDSLLDGGGRLLVTGHDIGFGLSDASAPSYTEEREFWLESTLKARYYYDNLYADTLTSVPASPVSGPVASPVYNAWGWGLSPDAGDLVLAAPNTDGPCLPDWTENLFREGYMGLHWESSTPRGVNGVGTWGGQKSRLVDMFFEWRALVGASTAHLPQRTAVLESAVSWLLGHEPPEVHLVLPTPGTVVASDFFAIKYSLRADAGRTIASRQLEYSLDGGATWAALTNAAFGDSGAVWDLAGVLGGGTTPNSTRTMLRVRVTDDGSPALQATAVMSGTFTLARPNGDTRGPVLVAGSVECSPVPLRNGVPASLFATFSDAETGGAAIAAAEYSFGAVAAPAGGGVPMTGAFGGAAVQATAALPTGSVVNGTMTLWVRARDARGNWGGANSITVLSSGVIAVGVEDEAAIDFLATPAPNPFRATSSIRFGLAAAGNVRLELFDVAGRRVRTLVDGTQSAGAHAATWDGRDDQGRAVASGVYFVQLRTPTQSFQRRIVALR